MIIIDGSTGEGGGQVLRSSLALSLVTGKAFRIENIRAKRKKPGLMRQHLTAARAAAEIGCAKIKGDSIGRMELEFVPGAVVPGEYKFSIGTAGSTLLVLQAVLPPLMTASGPSHLTLEGGTHNPFAPPYPFIEKAFLPVINRMGPSVECRIEKYGFYPVGGGRIEIEIMPVEKLSPIEIQERGEKVRSTATAIVSNLNPDIGKRELKVVQAELGLGKGDLVVDEVKDSPGPGNALVLEMEYENITEVFTGFGKHGFPAEKVAKKTVGEFMKYQEAGAPVGRHLADQLLIPFAMAGSGSFRTVKPTKHTFTNLGVIRNFMDIEIYAEKDGKVWEIRIG